MSDDPPEQVSVIDRPKYEAEYGIKFAPDKAVIDIMDRPDSYMRLHDPREVKSGPLTADRAWSTDISGDNEPERGYSTFKTAEEFFDYWDERGEPSDDVPVAIFTGKQTGRGVDDEPLAVPDMKRIVWVPYGDLKQIAGLGDESD